VVKKGKKPMSRKSAKTIVRELVAKFKANSETYVSKTSGYNETQGRTDFITPFLEAFGWNVRNGLNLPEDQRDVIEEASVEVGEERFNKKPDYELRVARQRKLFVEAKKPSTCIESDSHAAFQTRRYGFSASMPISILTNFEHLAVYDCITAPRSTDNALHCRQILFHFSEYETRFDELYDLFSREYILSGAFDKRFKVRPQYRGTYQFDALFLQQVRSWRLRLAEDIAEKNANITGSFLSYATQRFLTRLIFLRICEDRDIEKYETLKNLTGKGVYQAFKEYLKNADATYNSGLFSSAGDQSLGLKVGDAVLDSIISELYYPKSAYTFAVIEPGILGEIYELLLGETLQIGPKRKVRVILKPEVKASGGVYATPQYIVENIIKKTICTQIKGRSLSNLSNYSAADIACGSGIFLLVAYQSLLDYYREMYIRDGAKKHVGPRLCEASMGRLELTLQERRKILLKHIYGVDIDEQAVEVARFSLLLKLIERETADSLKAFVLSNNSPSLPSLDSNILHGNSLVSGKNLKDVYRKTASDLVPKIFPFEWELAFPFIKRRGGFSSIIGNPPYIRIQNMVGYSPEEVKIYRDRRCGYATATTDNFDKYALFVERAVNLLEPSGVLGFIVPNKFFTIKNGSQLRKLLSSGRHIADVVHFGAQQVFGTRALNYTCIIIATKAPSPMLRVERVSDLALWRYGHQGAVRMHKSTDLTEMPWRFAADEVEMVLSRIRVNNPKILDTVAEIFVGVQTSADKIYVIQPTGREKGYVTFMDQKGEKRKIEKDILYPFLHDVKIVPFGTPKANKFIIWPYQIMEGKMTVLTATELRVNYPFAWKYLSKYASTLRKRNILGGKTSNRKWYQFGRAQSMDKFNSEKIIATVLSREPKYGIERKNAVISGGGNGPYYAIRPTKGNSYSIYFILAILCHPISEAIIRTKTSVFAGGYYSHGKQFLEDLPVPRVDFDSPREKKKHDAVVEKVKKLISLTNSSHSSMTPATHASIKKQILMLREDIELSLNMIYGLTTADSDIIRSVPIPE